MTLVELSKDVFGVINSEDDSVYNGYGANQGFVLLEESVLLFDTGFTTEHACALSKMISNVTDKRVGIIVNSHYHSDHVFGNSYFLKNNFQGISPLIVSHEICREDMKRNSKNRLREYKARQDGGKLEEKIRDVEVSFPSFSYLDNLTHFKLQGKEFFLIHPETGAHTLGDTLLAIPGSGVIFAGDVLSNGFYPNLEDANIDGWIDALNSIDYLTYTTFLPGHGDPCGSDKVVAFRNYLVEAQKRLLLASDSMSTEEKRKCFAIEGTDSWKLKAMVDANLAVLLETNGATS